MASKARRRLIRSASIVPPFPVKGTPQAAAAWVDVTDSIAKRVPAVTRSLASPARFSCFFRLVLLRFAARLRLE
jgi:hypothetical protein